MLGWICWIISLSHHTVRGSARFKSLDLLLTEAQTQRRAHERRSCFSPRLRDPGAEVNPNGQKTEDHSVQTTGGQSTTTETNYQHSHIWSVSSRPLTWACMFLDSGHRETVSYHSSTQNLHLSLYNNSNNSPILLTSASLHFPLTARFVSFLSLM